MWGFGRGDVGGKQEDGYRKVLLNVTVLLYIDTGIEVVRGVFATQSVYCHTTETELTIFRAVYPLNFLERRENKESCLSENSFAFLFFLPYLPSCPFLILVPPRHVVTIVSYRYAVVGFYS